jgi:predicted ferric reductase
MITTRLRNTAFKHVLKNLPENTAVNMSGPVGSFTLDNDRQKPVIFLTGGIGITLVYNIIKQATHDHLPYTLFLFYSNHTADEAVFMTDIVTYISVHFGA